MLLYEWLTFGTTQVCFSGKAGDGSLKMGVNIDNQAACKLGFNDVLRLSLALNHHIHGQCFANPPEVQKAVDCLQRGGGSR